MFDKFTNLIISSFLKWMAHAQITQASECHPNCHNSESFRFMVISFFSHLHIMYFYLLLPSFSFLFAPFFSFFLLFPLPCSLCFRRSSLAAAKFMTFVRKPYPRIPTSAQSSEGLGIKRENSSTTSVPKSAVSMFSNIFLVGGKTIR